MASRVSTSRPTCLERSKRLDVVLAADFCSRFADTSNALPAAVGADDNNFRLLNLWANTTANVKS